MFTGIIRARGRVADVQSTAHGARLTISADGAFACAPGESISVNGCCLTLREGASPGRLEFDVIPATLRCTTLGSLGKGAEVNLEPAVTAATMLSGHIVQGHVDGVGLAARRGGGISGDIALRIHPPAPLMACIMQKGSVAVDGVSLTVSDVGDDWFEVALIPETLARTTLARIDSASEPVNIEVDYLVKAMVSYLDRLERTPRISRG
jgi:riboflavin synthase